MSYKGSHFFIKRWNKILLIHPVNIKYMLLPLFCGKNWLITIHSAEVDLARSIRKLLEHENKKLVMDSIEALFYSVLSELIDRYEQVLTAVELTITDLEAKALSDPSRETIQYLASTFKTTYSIQKAFLACKGCSKLFEPYGKRPRRGKIYSGGI